MVNTIYSILYAVYYVLYSVCIVLCTVYYVLYIHILCTYMPVTANTKLYLSILALELAVIH